MIPSNQHCFILMDKYNMPHHIKEHSIKVAMIGKLIGENLIKIGADISLEKIVSGALMHDIAKIGCISTKENHCSIGKNICLNEGLDEIADIVAEHVFLSHKTVDHNKYCEKEIVYYADKRVMHDVIVNLDERLADLFIRYPKLKLDTFTQLMLESFELCKQIEYKIFSRLPFGPNDVIELVKGIVL